MWTAVVLLAALRILSGLTRRNRQTILSADSEHLRRGIGEVAEPGNVAAGGTACRSGSAAWAAVISAPTCLTSSTWRLTSLT